MKHAEKIVKIHQTVFLKINFEVIPKNTFFGFCQNFSQAMDEVEIFFLPISQSLGP
jgi:hypothetical protein